MYTSINTTNQTELSWSSGYRDTTTVRRTRFNSHCRAILFFLFLQLLVVKIPNFILSDRENTENQSHLSKKRANKLFHLFHTCHSIRAIKMPSIYTWINTTNLTQLSWSSGYRDTTIVRLTRFNSRSAAILFFSFSATSSCQNTKYHFIRERKRSKPNSFTEKNSKQAFPLIPHVPQHKSN